MLAKKRIIALLLLILITAALASCAYFNLLGEFECAEYTCRLYGLRSVERIKVISGGKTVATLNTKGALTEGNNYGFNFIDANFDGYDDICLEVKTDDDGTKYSFWIWNPIRKNFSTDRILNSLLSPVFDYGEGTVTAPYRSRIIEPVAGPDPEAYIDDEGVVTYEWRQGVLVAVRRECITYYSESDIYCVAVWEINEGGELEAIRERWLRPEQYERAGYPPISGMNQ